MKVLKLKEQAAELWQEMRSLQDLVKAEKRDLTLSEKTWFDRSMKDYGVLERDLFLARSEEKRSGHNAFSNVSQPVPIFAKLARSTYLGESQHRAITTTSGAGTIDTDQLTKEWIPFLHDENVIQKLGIRVEQSNDPNKKWPSVSGKPSVAWPSEGSALSEDSAMTISSVSRTDYTVAVGPLLVSVQALQDADSLLDEVINETFVSTLTDEVLRVIWHGSGSGQPTGLDSVSNINVITSSAALQSITPPYGPFADGAKKLAFDKCNTDNISVALSTEHWGQILKLYATDDQPLQLPDEMQKWNWVHTDSIDGSFSYMGDFSKMRLWFRSFSLRLVERYANSLQVGFILYARVSVDVLEAKHFCKLIGVTAGSPTT